MNASFSSSHSTRNTLTSSDVSPSSGDEGRLLKVARSATAFSLLLAGLGLTGCEPTVADKKADSVREATQNQAEDVRDASQVEAEKMRDANGRTITGSAQDGSVERAADAVEDAGERKADQVENEGERAADTIEENNNP